MTWGVGADRCPFSMGKTVGAKDATMSYQHDSDKMELFVEEFLEQEKDHLHGAIQYTEHYENHRK